MNTKKEVSHAELDAVSKLEGCLLVYKHDLMSIIELSLEELYGGTKTEPSCTEENEERVLEIWNKAVGECIKKVKELA